MFYYPPYWDIYGSIPFQQVRRVPASCPPGFQQYTVVQGDSIFLIAQRFGVSVNTLIAANPHIPDPNVLFVGDVLCVPIANGVCPPGTEVYVIRPGDTLIGIAQRFGVPLETLLQANPQITNPNIIFPGEVICIPPSRPLLPCCIYLSIRELDARGSAFFEEFGGLGQFSVGILTKDLPSADEFGDFNRYIAEIIVPDIDTYTTELNSVTNEPTLLAGRIIFSLPQGISELPINTEVYVRPFNRETGERGPVILRGSLQECRTGF